MRNITVLLLSDIHLLINKEMENQGLVIAEFFKDLDKTLKNIPVEDRFCIISGDLVQVGALSQSYITFAERFLNQLIKHVSLRNIVCIPGNHDLNRQYVESHRDDYDKWLVMQDETQFNAEIKKHDYFNRAFEHFINFRNTCLVAEGQNIFGFQNN